MRHHGLAGIIIASHRIDVCPGAPNGQIEKSKSKNNNSNGINKDENKIKNRNKTRIKS